MTTWRRGDIVLSGTKRRPTVVVSSDRYNTSSPDLMIASITGNLRAVHHPGGHVLTDWLGAGLLRPSLVQAKIATVESTIIERRLGTLSAGDLAALDRGLREALVLP